MAQFGFTFNGKHTTEFDAVFRSINRPVLPTLRERQLVIDGRDGRYDFQGNSYDNRFIELECFISQQPTMQALRSKIREIALWLSKKAYLIFDDESEKKYYGRLYRSIPLENIQNSAIISLLFEVEPFAYGENITITEDVTTSGENIIIEYDGTKETGGRFVIRNTGTTNIDGFSLVIGQN